MCGFNPDFLCFLFYSGGVEPIAEVAGEWGEVDVPKETTKFIKQKQPSKKVKKGTVKPNCG